MKARLIKRIAQQASAKGVPFRLLLTNGKSITVPSEEFLWITDDLLGVAHSTNPQSGLPSNPTFLDPKEVAEVEIPKRKTRLAAALGFGGFAVVLKIDHWLDRVAESIHER